MATPDCNFSIFMVGTSCPTGIVVAQAWHQCPSQQKSALSCGHGSSCIQAYILNLFKTSMPTLPDYPGVSWIETESPDLPYG